MFSQKKKKYKSVVLTISQRTPTFCSLFLAAISVILLCNQLERFIAPVGFKHSAKIRVSCEESKESESHVSLRP